LRVEPSDESVDRIQACTHQSRRATEKRKPPSVGAPGAP
jgi:hypothetical protein